MFGSDQQGMWADSTLKGPKITSVIDASAHQGHLPGLPD